MDSFSADMTFSEAAPLWFEAHSVYIRPNTKRSYSQYIGTLKKSLGEIRLCDIRPGTIRAYQQWRSQTACAIRANAECVILQMILKEAGLWKNLKDSYRPLPPSKKKVRQSMSPAQEARFLEVCIAKPERRLAGHCLIVMANTTMGFGELRHLRRSDVYLDEETPYVTVNRDGAKNEFRERTIPLNFLAHRSMKWIIERWEELGGTAADQYILPHRSVRGSGTQFHVPMAYINNAARAILNDAGLNHLVPYDMRSHATRKS